MLSKSILINTLVFRHIRTITSGDMETILERSSSLSRNGLPGANYFVLFYLVVEKIILKFVFCYLQTSYMFGLYLRILCVIKMFF